jgi:hypothetical protein
VLRHVDQRRRVCRGLKDAFELQQQGSHVSAALCEVRYDLQPGILTPQHGFQNLDVGEPKSTLAWPLLNGPPDVRT